MDRHLKPLVVSVVVAAFCLPGCRGVGVARKIMKFAAADYSNGKSQETLGVENERSADSVPTVDPSPVYGQVEDQELADSDLEGEAGAQQSQNARQSRKKLFELHTPKPIISNNEISVAAYEQSGAEDIADQRGFIQAATIPIADGTFSEASQRDTGLAAGVGGIENQQGRFPIDFPTVLQLAGADNWNVQIARQRVKEAEARYQAARVAWLPSLNFGIGYNHHEGQLQETEGDVIEVSRQSLFVGGASVVANSPAAAGAGGPPRMFVDLSLADAILQPLAARQLFKAERARRCSVVDDVMLAASVAYFELVRAQSQLAVARQNLDEARQAYELTLAFVEAGKGTEADSSRLQFIVNQRENQTMAAQAAIEVASVRLATVLQLDPAKLDPNQGLYALEFEATPIQLVDPNVDLSLLIAEAETARTELFEAEARAQAAFAEARAEQLRPWLPNLYFGLSGGGFGGGQGSEFPKLDTRSDVDVVMTWQLENLGAGTRAARRISRSRLEQTVSAGRQLKDQIAEQVAATYHQVQLYLNTISLAQANIEQADNALQKNIDAIRGLEGMPLEAVQSLEFLAQARNQYLDAIISYNQSQLRLLRAVGQPISKHGSMPTTTN